MKKLHTQWILWSVQSEPQEEDQSRTPVTLTQGSHKEAVESKEILVNIKKTNEKSYENYVDNINVDDQEILDKIMIQPGAPWE